MLFTLVVPLFMLLVFRSSGQDQALFSHAPELTFPLGAGYSLLLLTNLSYNNFGADGSGVQFFFASPAPFRQIVAGKNLAHATILALEVALVWIGTSLLYRAPSIAVTLATLAGILFALPIDLAAGNLFSIYSPTKIEAGVFGRQRASLTTVLASFGIRGLLFGGAFLMLWFSRHYGTSWIVLPAFLMPVAAAGATYAAVLGRVDSIALDHRDNLISQLSPLAISSRSVIPTRAKRAHRRDLLLRPCCALLCLLCACGAPCHPALNPPLLRLRRSG